MTYSIEWDESALDYLRKLQKDISERIINKVELLKDNPFRFLEYYEGRYYKLRIGDYRAVVDVIISMNKIIVIRIGHRKNIYD